MTNTDPTIAFHRALSEYGLHPDEILWDSRIHHFRGKDKAEKSPRNKSAWYIAFEDRAGGVFGDYSQGLEKVPWQMKRHRAPTLAEREEWKRKDAKIAKRQAEARARAGKEVQAAWDAAVPANTANVHPYLKAKRIDRSISNVRVLKKGTRGLEILGQGLQRSEQRHSSHPDAQEGSKLVNVQRIFDGTSKRYWPGAEVVGDVLPRRSEETTSSETRRRSICARVGPRPGAISECVKSRLPRGLQRGWAIVRSRKRIRKKYDKVQPHHRGRQRPLDKPPRRHAQSRRSLVRDQGSGGSGRASSDP